MSLIIYILGDIMDSNLFWCIIGIIGGGFLSLLISAVFFFIGLKRKYLSYYIKTFCLISNKVNQISDLEIQYHNQKLDHLFLSTITFTNTGNSIIEYKDFVPSYLPFLYTNGEFIRSDTLNLDSTELNKNCIIKITYTNNNKANLNFDYIAKKGKISLSFFHTEDIFLVGN